MSAELEQQELLPEGRNAAVSGYDAGVAFEPVPAEDTVSGDPQQGITELGAVGGVDVGIWELRAGVTTDTEVDELFVVLSGAAKIELLSGPDAGTTVEVKAGDVMRLVGGTETRWTVEDHIRKVYIAAE